MNYVDEEGVRQKRARFKFSPGVEFPAPGMPPIADQKVLEKVQVIAAGGIAESMFFGGEPRGRAKDLGDIDRLKRVAPPLDRAAIEQQVRSGFPETEKLLNDHRERIVRIGDAALVELKRLGLDRQDDFQETVVLSAEEVRRLYHLAGQN